MSATSAFDHVCDGSERGTSLDRLQCRGTVRLMWKEAGLDAGRVQPNEIAVVVRRLLPGALRSCGVDAPDALFEELARAASRGSRPCPRPTRPTRSSAASAAADAPPLPLDCALLEESRAVPISR